MNDRFKFRAWDKELKQMIGGWTDGYTIEFLGLGGFIVRWGEKCENVESEERFELMQSTGLKDKNGKLIFEGDIVDYMRQHSVDDIEELSGPVKFHNGAFYVEDAYEDSLYLLAGCGISLEIIGNIYEHKHLLETPELLTQ